MGMTELYSGKLTGLWKSIHLFSNIDEAGPFIDKRSSE
jgi:hypothetical protein